MTPEEVFAKRFGRLQREIGDAVVSFYQDVGELPDPVPPDQTVFWMDDQRTLLLLSVCGPDDPVDRIYTPTSWWQHLKGSLKCPWISFQVRELLILQKANGHVRTEADIAQWTKTIAERTK